MTPGAFFADPLAALGRLLAEAPAAAARLRPLPLWALALLAAGGLAVLLAGARWRRPLALVGGAAVGFLSGTAAAGALGLPGGIFPLLGAVVLGVAALLLPALYPFGAGALLGALLGARLPVPGHGVVAAGIGLFLAGGLALLGARLLAAATAGAVGAALVGAALVGSSRAFPGLSLLTERPVLLAGLVLVLAISGTAFQSGSAWRGGAPRPRKAAPAPPGEPAAA